MLKDKEKGTFKYTIKTSQRQAFMQVFNLHAKDGKVNKQGLKAIFDRVGYYISQQHFQDICGRAFQFKQEVTFEDFMQIFKIKESPHSLVDIKNAFKLIAEQEDQFIPLQTIHELFRKVGIEKERVDDLLVVLSDFVDAKMKMFNYKLFLSQLY